MKAPSARERAINAIIADVARNGKAGHEAMRAYVEARISHKTFKEAVAKGMGWYSGDAQRPAPSQSDKSELPS